MKHWIKRISHLVCGLMFALLLMPASTHAAPQDDNIIPSNPYDLIPSQRVENMRVSIETGQPLVLYMVNYPVKADTPETMARQYLAENASSLQLKDAQLNDLHHSFTRQSLSGTTVRFNQTSNGIPVYKGAIAVHINNQNMVTYVTNDYQANVELESNLVSLQPEEARDIAHKAIGVEGKPRFDTSELVLYKNVLAYQVRVVAEAPIGDWEAFVNAGTGEVISVENIAFDFQDDKIQPPLVQQVDGTGLIWNPDPLTVASATYGDPGYSDNLDADSPQLAAAQSSVTLRDIQFTAGQYTLISPYAAIVDSESPFKGLFSQASSTFNFNRNQDGFEAVQTFYHIDDSMRYLNLTLGLTIAPTQYAGGVRFDPHGLGGADNSHYLGSTGEVAFGEGGVDDSEDSDVIHHELGHGLHDWVTGGNLSQVNGLSEGSGDYWAQSYNRTVESWTPADPAYHYVFRWDGHNEFWAGRTTNYGAVYPGGLTGSIHTDGQIWSTCMMKVYDAIGRTKTDTIFWEGLGMTGSSTNQEDAAIAVYQAALDLGYSLADRLAIRGVFETCVYNIPADPPNPNPDFSVVTTPPTQSICAGNNASYNVTVTGMNSFVGAVDMSATGNPGLASFSPDPITPDGVSVLTISGAAVGAHNFDVVGTGVVTPSLIHSNTIDLEVVAVAPTMPSLLTPANGATGVSPTPNLTWSALGNAGTYDIDIATDAGFINIVETANVTINSYTPSSSLALNTTHYWRVRANNGCGSSDYSTTNNFTTQDIPPGSLVCNGATVDFEAGIPADWTLEDNGGNFGWTTTGAPDCSAPNWSGANETPGSGTAACADADDNNNPAAAYDAEMWTNSLNLTGMDAVTLTYAAAYNDIGTADTFDVDVSIDGGTNWTNEVNWTTDHWAPGETVVVDLTPYADNSNVLVRFRYHGTGWDWWAEVDDVSLACSTSAFPVITVEPVSMDSTQATDTQMQQTLTISNTGTADLNWTIVEDSGLVGKNAGIQPQNYTGDVPENNRLTETMSAFLADKEAVQETPALALTPCVAGNAGGYACNNVDLMAFMPLANIGGGSGNDIWGWTGCNGREFALMGRTSGTAFVEITDPVNPVYLGNLPTHTFNSSWRDIKTYADHAFIVSEASGHGMQIFDLNQLCTANPGTTFSNTAHFNGFGAAHNIVINEDSGFAYKVGSSTCSGGLHMIDISNPTNPTDAGCFSSDGYTHDAQCVIYNGPDLAHIGKEICFNSNEDTITIVDVTNKSNPIQLSRTGYTGSSYTHQGWLTEDQSYFLLDDETDEQGQGHNTRTRIWDVSDLDAPILDGFVDGATPAIDHNLYIKGHTVYESNYRAGLRILDGSDVGNLNLPEIAFFDVYPGSNSASFNGNWSNYPYYDSDLVVASHIESGLFILRPNLGTAAADFVMKTNLVVLETCGGSTQTTLTFDDVYGFSNNVNLSVSGVPANGVGSFSNNPVLPNGSSVLTITDNGIASGDYLLQVTGTGGTVTHKEYIKLMTTAAVQAFSLSSPADSSTGVSIMPALSWAAAPNATDYLVEIATDVGFSNIVYTQTVAITSHNVSTMLNGNTEYFWRVTASNGCSQLVASSQSFTTAGAPVCTAPVDIPWASLSSTAGTTMPGLSTDVTVTFDSTGLLSGTYTGTLCISSNDMTNPLVQVPLSLTVPACSAPNPPANVTIVEMLNGTDTQLSWLSTGDTAYTVWYMVNNPYFTPGDPGSVMATVPDNAGTVTWTHNASVGSSSDNYYYVVFNSCGDAGAGGGGNGGYARTAEFDFDILPGTP